MAEKKNGISKFVIDTVMIVFSLYKVIPNFISLVEMEARLAGRSVVKLLILYLLSGVLLLSIWMCINGMCFAYLISLQFSFIFSFFLMTIINLMLWLVVALAIVKTAKNFSFTRTRRLLGQINK